MKRFLRNPRTQAVLGWLLYAYLRLVAGTIRWRHENLPALEPALAAPQGLVCLFWHGRICLVTAMLPQWRRKPTKGFVSPSADGEFIAQALERLGFPSIRASSAKPGDSAKARAAVGALREAVAWTGGGGALIVSPDGPRGPNEVVAGGAVQVARRAGVPVYLAGLAAAPALRLDTWDKAMLPALFGRGAVVWDGPLHAPADADDDALIADWSARLSAATRRAEALAVDRAPPR